MTPNLMHIHNDENVKSNFQSIYTLLCHIQDNRAKILKLIFETILRLRQSPSSGHPRAQIKLQKSD